MPRGRPVVTHGMRVRDAMSSPAVTAPSDATLEDIARLMLDERVGSVVIVSSDDAEHPVGIVTETDFDVADDPVPFTFFKWPSVFGSPVWDEESLEEVYARARTRTAESVMSSPIVSVDEDAELWQAVETMVRHELKRLPVLRGNRLVGIVTRHDLLKCLVAEAPAAS